MAHLKYKDVDLYVALSVKLGAMMFLYQVMK